MKTPRPPRSSHGPVFLLGSLLGAGLLGSSCSPALEEPPEGAAERYAEALCEAHERCGCLGQGFASASECSEEVIASFERVAEVPGLEFHPECFDEVLEHLRTASCGGESEEVSIPCLVFTGTLEPGSECTPDWVIGPPAGLTGGPCTGDGLCIGGRCARPPASSVGEGAPCHLELGVGCGGAPNLHCAPDGICRPSAAAGGACETPVACSGSSLYCAGLEEGDDAPGTCRERIPSGGSCDPDEFTPCAVGYTGYCSAQGVCMDEWPAVCVAAHPPPGSYQALDWIPLSRGG